MVGWNIVDELYAAGYLVQIMDDGSPRLVKYRDDGKLSRELSSRVKEYRQEVICAVQCVLCKRHVPTAEERDNLNSPALCDKSQCPYKPRKKW